MLVMAGEVMEEGRGLRGGGGPRAGLFVQKICPWKQGVRQEA